MGFVFPGGVWISESGVLSLSESATNQAARASLDLGDCRHRTTAGALLKGSPVVTAQQQAPCSRDRAFMRRRPERRIAERKSQGSSGMIMLVG